ncbi:PREDICTED: uncharacterized protein LOC109165411 [Ipomoea nil]|uniref:uncharacterized protein LOC109165411 n=1 Tax=Ipomoea nil TaxID=35883 RepID=UPI000900B9CC|nr:PREDICTED: uncharacterized protein LOC109165411 [Ipomoea nil]
MNPTTMEESKYVYLLHQRGLFRVNVSAFDQPRRKHEELKLECVLYDQSNFIFTDMALFSHRHNLFMIGGASAESNFYTFDPNRFNEFPVKNLECFREPATFNNGYQPVKWPFVVRAENRFCIVPDSVDNFHFQSFDPAGNRFHSLPPPPFDKREGFDSVSGVLPLRDFIYLFLRESCGSCIRAFSFNTRLLQWREEEPMRMKFKEEGIPLPYDHRGEVGLSDKFSGDTQIMVALSDRMPTAYRVCIHPKGSLVPKSYRHLREVHIENDDRYEDRNVARLLDLGGGKFCLIDYSNSALVVCVFKIDFAVEHEIQIDDDDEIVSSEILASRKFQDDDIPFVRNTWFTDVCLAYAPAMQIYSSAYSPRSPPVSSSAPETQSYSPLYSVHSCNERRPEYEVSGGPSNEDEDSDDFYLDEEAMEAYQEHKQFEGSAGARSSSSLVSKRYKEKGKKEERESPEHDPVALARSLARHFETKGLDKTGDNALSRWFMRTQLKSIMYGLAMIDRADASSEKRIIQEAGYAAAEAKVKALELQLEASNKAYSAARAQLEALKHEKIKLRETVKAQRKQLKAKDEELVSTRDKAIQEWRQSEEFRQAARSYAREDRDSRKRRCRSRD